MKGLSYSCQKTPKLLLFFILLLFLFSCQKKQKADLVFINARLYLPQSGDEMPIANVLIKGNTIWKITTDDPSPWIDAETQVFDAKENLLSPGLIDAHIHPISGAESTEVIFLSGLKNQNEIRESIRSYVEANPDLEFYQGRGWELSAFPDGNPKKEFLDELLPDKPIVLRSWDGHSAWVNSKALELANITSQTPDPANGRIEKDPKSGEPSGTLRETASGLLSPIIPKVNQDEKARLLKKAIAILHSYGITGFIDASVGRSELEAYRQLDHDGELKARVITSLALGTEKARPLDTLIAWRKEFFDLSFSPSSVKIFADGVPEAHTAALLEPYLDREDDHGILNFSADTLALICQALDREGFQIHIHALGDAAIQYSLEALKENNTALRHHICHLQVIKEEDWGKFAKYGVIANFQPYWAQGDELNLDVIEPIIGDDRSKDMYPLASIAASGATLCAGSDWPVSTENPFLAMQVAVTRKQPWKAEDTPYKAHQAITIAEIFQAYTANNAWLMHKEKHLGRLEEGRLADLVLLDRNLFSIPLDSIGNTKALMTLFNGEIVYQNGTF